MRIALTCLMIGAAPAWAQAPAAPPFVPEKAAATCPECGVVRSVRSVKKELGSSPSIEAKPSGLVATIPLGGGKPQVGSSTKIGKDAVTTSESWEIIVRLDDGRFRVVNVDENPDLREGDKVRVEPNGQIKRRTD